VRTPRPTSFRKTCPPNALTLVRIVNQNGILRRRFGVVRANQFFRQARKILPAEVIAQGRAGALGINVGGTDLIDYIIQIDRPEIDAEARITRSIRYRGMQVGRRKENNAADLADHPHLWIEFNRLFRFRLFLCVSLHLLRSGGPAFLVPAIVVVVPRAVFNRPGPILRMERQAVFKDDVVDGKIPVDLALRCRVPGVPMGVKRIGEARREVGVGTMKSDATAMSCKSNWMGFILGNSYRWPCKISKGTALYAEPQKEIMLRSDIAFHFNGQIALAAAAEKGLGSIRLTDKSANLEPGRFGLLVRPAVWKLMDETNDRSRKQTLREHRKQMFPTDPPLHRSK
jgi:hypothetical protein